MKRDYKTIFISVDWLFEENLDTVSIQHKKNVIEFTKKLFNEFDLKLITTKDEIMAAKWLIDNNARCLVECLVNEASACWLYLNDDCIKNCKNFEKFYETIISFKE